MRGDERGSGGGGGEIAYCTAFALTVAAVGVSCFVVQILGPRTKGTKQKQQTE